MFDICKLQLGTPKFEVNECQEKLYQAVLTNRTAIPNYLQLTLEQVIEYLVSVENNL